ncbi:MAG TPA: type II toxin-antitoxin system VapC family toxin [Candidatus Thermoplasmatota archaeon]|nr:type II toxin-antitoxin system VapC family toxin [Candidatus Thermoplasmatota archaeon]
MTDVLVLDASAAVDAMWRERPHWGLALAALQGSRATVAPSLLAHEIAHIVHVKRRRDFAGSTEDRSEVVAGILDGVELVEVDVTIARRVGALAEAERISGYDAAYLDVAESREGSMLLTQDGRLRAAAVGRLGPARCIDLDEAASRLARGEV